MDDEGMLQWVRVSGLAWFVLGGEKLWLSMTGDEGFALAAFMYFFLGWVVIKYSWDR